MLGLLRARGVTFVEGPEKADIVLINTCGFLQEAVQEAEETLEEILALKERGGLGKILVAGCWVQRYGYCLGRAFPGVDLWLGTGALDRVTDILGDTPGPEAGGFHIGRPSGLFDHRTPRVPTTPPWSRYLKITDGCSHRCTFCLIPALRGPLRSRIRASLMEEAEGMVAEGTKEIVLIGQDITAYGAERGEVGALESLVEGLLGIRGLTWLRLLYLHPSGVTERLLDLLASEEALCPYLDIPIQHVNDALLGAMGRTYRKRDLYALLGRLRKGRREISLRTTVMVGFPGETEAMFRELCAFIEEVGFDHLGAFVFSPEKGTAGARMEPQVPETTGARRWNRVMEIQRERSEKRNRARVGKTFPVLLSGPGGGIGTGMTGRTSWMAPEVDGQVLITKGEGTPGSLRPCAIVDADAYDLYGEIV